MTPSRDIGTFSTANLCLASFLSHHDKQYQLVRGGGRSATWEFSRSQVAGLVLEFEQGEAQVEPQAFQHSLTHTRRTLFDFLNSREDVWNPAKIKARDPRSKAVASA